MMVIEIDTREQRPYEFEAIKADIPFKTRLRTLKTGDYATSREDAFDGWPDIEDNAKLMATVAVVERKSLADLYGTVGGGRVRFQAEIERMALYGYAAIVIEAPLDHILRPGPYLKFRTRLHPRSVIGSLIAWQQRFGIHIWPVASRRMGEQLTHRLLERWVRDQ